MKHLIFLVTLAILISFHSVAMAITIKDAVFKTKNAGKVVFSHSDHLQENGITDNCRICHNAIFDLRKKTSYTMADMAKGKSCGACHNGKKGFPLEKCARCHQTREILFKESSTGDVKFSHKFHGGLYTCVDCHTTIYKTVRSKVKISMQAMEAGKSCGACHDGKTAFSVKEKCEACHKI